MLVVAAILVGYGLGCAVTGYYLVRWRTGQDIRALGSGKVGATNVGRRLGRRFFALVFTLDLLKGLLPMLAAAYVLRGESGSEAGDRRTYVLWLLVGAAAIAGHLFSVFLGFKGGKGVATSLGVLIGLSPLVAGLVLSVFLLVVAVTRYVSLGSILAALTQALLFWLPLFNGHAAAPLPFRLFGLLAATFVVFKHGGNIERLRKGTEARFGEKKPNDAPPIAAA